MTKLDFSDRKTGALFADAVNEGYSACLNGQPRDANPYMDAEGYAAWEHGRVQASRSGNVLLVDDAEAA